MSTFEPTGPADRSGRSQRERREAQLLSDLSKGLDVQHHNTSVMHEFGSAFDAPQTVLPNITGPGSVGTAPSPARSDHQHGTVPATFVYPVLQNGWQNYGAGWQDVRYYKQNERVYIEGRISGGQANTPIFNLATGFRPVKHIMADPIQKLKVLSDGNISLESVNGPVDLSGSWLVA